ncbi:MAG: hypothetical protein OXO50_02450 [Caldilineaceae bacterium]|nr:hypothetical protein [Caldilineaceae bacterium]
MRNSNDVAVQRIGMGGRWKWRDLMAFGWQYERLYSVLYVLEFSSDIRKSHYFRENVGKSPWLGGWSVVNFYNAAAKAVPENHEMRVERLHYSSPGFIDIALAYAVAKVLRLTIREFSRIPGEIRDEYHRWHREARKHRLLMKKYDKQIRDLDRDEYEFCKKATTDLFHRLQLGHLLPDLERLGGHPLIQMKIAFSLVRRLIKINDLQGPNERLDFKASPLPRNKTD